MTSNGVEASDTARRAVAAFAASAVNCPASLSVCTSDQRMSASSSTTRIRRGGESFTTSEEFPGLLMGSTAVTSVFQTLYGSPLLGHQESRHTALLRDDSAPPPRTNPAVRLHESRLRGPQDRTR